MTVQPQGVEAESAQAGWSRWPIRIAVLSPLITLPLSKILFDGFAWMDPNRIGLPSSGESWLFGTQHWGYAQIPWTFVAILLPGLVNLTPFAWLLAEEKRTKAAAIVAGSSGIFRLAVPLFLLLSAVQGEARVPGSAEYLFGDSDFKETNGPGDNFVKVDGRYGGSYFWYSQYRGIPHPVIEIWPVGALAWLVTLGLWGILEIDSRTGRTGAGGSGVVAGRQTVTPDPSHASGERLCSRSSA